MRLLSNRRTAALVPPADEHSGWRDIRNTTERRPGPNRGMNSAWIPLVHSSSAKDAMLVTLVAVLCNGQLCLEKVVTDSEQSGITMTACAVQGQIGIAEWLANGPYHEWKLQRYKCILGKYIPKNDA
jgi:hypothetical protein